MPVKIMRRVFSAAMCAVFLFFAGVLAAEQPAAQNEPAEQKADISYLQEEMVKDRQLLEREPMEYRRKLEQVITREERATPSEIESYIRFMPSCGARAQSGKVGLIDSQFSYSYEFKALDKLPMQVSFEQEYISINNSTVVKLPAYLVGLTLNVAGTAPLLGLDKTYFRLELSPSTFRGDWNFRASSFRMPIKMMGIYQPNEKLTWILGVAVFPDFEDPVLPFVGAIYQPNDKWFFNLVPRRPGVYYNVNDRLSVFCEGDFGGGEYSVNKDNYRDTILSYDEAHAGLGVKYQLNKAIQALLSCGGTFNRRFQYQDSLGKVRIGNGFYSEFRMQANF